MSKKMWQSLCSVTIAVVLVATSFLSPVFASSGTNTTYDIDDVYSKLQQIYNTLHSYSDTNGVNYNTAFIKRILTDNFDTNNYSYVINNQVMSGQSFHQAISDMINQNNEILMSIVSSYVDPSDNSVHPGLFDKIDDLNNYLSAISSYEATQAGNVTTINNKLNAINNDLDSIDSYLSQIRDSLVVISQNSYDIPYYSWSAMNGFLNGFSGEAMSRYKHDYYGYYLTGAQLTNKHPRFNWSGKYYLIYATNQYNNALSSIDNGSFSLVKVNNSNNLYFKVYELTGNGQWTLFTFDYMDSSTQARKDVRIYPIYFGPTSNLPNDLEFLLGNLFSNKTTSLLTDIKSLVNDIVSSITGSNSNNSDSAVNKLNDKVNNINDSLNDYDDQFDHAVDQIDVTGLSNTIDQHVTGVNFISSQIGSVVSWLSPIWWLFLIPLVLALIMLFVR